MTIFAVVNDTNGMIDRIVMSEELDISHVTNRAGESAIVVDSTISPLLHKREGGEWVALPLPTVGELNAVALQELRAMRNTALSRSDWAEHSTRLTSSEAAAWAAYRALLFDLPDQYPNILSLDEVTWPLAPSSHPKPE